MTEPIYFVVERTAGGGEMACIYRDRLPDRLTRKIPKGSVERPLMIYQLRLDRLDPEPREFWLRQDTGRLLAAYRAMRDQGKLPPENIADPPRAKPQSGRQLGEWWTPPAKPWDDRKPAEPLPIP